MMELGATICLPRGPLCLQCPVMELCRTRGEHVTTTRAGMKRMRVAHLLLVRNRAGARQVLLERRAKSATLMAGMLELPPLPLEAIVKSKPALHVKHAITNTNYEVDIFTENLLRKQIPAARRCWSGCRGDAGQNAADGLARKVLVKMGVMQKR